MTAASRKGSADGRTSDVESQITLLERGNGEGDIDFGDGKSLHVSSLSKIFFPKPGVTKGALMRYYVRIWPALQPHVRDRPLVLKRYPNGVGRPMFFQQNAGQHVPDVVRVETLNTVDEGPKARLIGGDLPTLLYTVQLGAIEVHPWLSSLPDADAADRCLIDLDPGDDVPFTSVVSLARDVLAIATQCGLPMALKTSGSSGMHLVIPLPSRTPYEVSAQLAQLIARATTAHRSDLATVERSIRARPAGTIYVDALQNARGKSMACAYSVRATDDATVSTPVRARELTSKLRTSAFTVRTLPARVNRTGDLWGDALRQRPTAKSIRTAMTVLEQVLEDAPPTTKPPRSVKRSRGAPGARSATGHPRTQHT